MRFRTLIRFSFIKLLILIAVIPPVLVFGQESKGKKTFRSPLDIPLFLTGNFGELRNNHFHSGLDIRTQGAEGKNVYSIEDGYVSRIKITAGGYGKALYITHPDGYVSVYGHLRSFNKEIGAYVLAEQYKKESFEVDLFPESTMLRVNKADIVAYSGNSGGSGGPHLHFEIRDVKTEHALNPAFFGFDMKDATPPVIRKISVYPVGSQSFVNEKRVPYHADATGGGLNHRLISKDRIRVFGKIGLGIETHDLMEGSPGKNGVYSVELIVNGKRIYFHQLDEFSFDNTRYINSHIDYAEKVRNGRLIQKSFVDPNNQLRMYKDVVNRGILEIKPDSAYVCKYIVKDTDGNTSGLEFELLGVSKSPVGEAEIKSEYKKVMAYDQNNFFKTDEIDIHFKENTFYDTLYFEYSKGDKPADCHSPLHRVHNRFTPVHIPYVLTIVVDSMSTALKEKAVVVLVKENGDIESMGGTMRGDRITTKVRMFGNFTVKLDTVAPKITPLNIDSGKNMLSTKSIRVKISDNLSGISSYRGTIDDEWILMDYDAKNALLEYAFDKALSEGEHRFRLEVKDGAGNVSILELSFKKEKAKK